MNHKRTLMTALIIGLCLFLSVGSVLAGKGGSGGGKPGGGGGDPNPLDALLGPIVFEVNPNASDNAWFAMDPNGQNIRAVSIAGNERVTGVSVSPYPVHVLCRRGETWYVRPLETSGTEVALLTEGQPYSMSDVKFRYRDPDAGLGAEVDAVVFAAYDTREAAPTPYYFFSLELVRNGAGIVTGTGPLTRLGQTPGGGFFAIRRVAPDGVRVVSAAADGSWPYTDSGIYTLDITTGAVVSYPVFDATSCVRAVLWAPTPDFDLWAYQVKPCGTSDCSSVDVSVVVADVDLGSMTTVSTSDWCYETAFSPGQFAPDGTYLSLSGPGKNVKRGGYARGVWVVPTDGSSAPVKILQTASLGRELGEVFWGAQLNFGN